MFKSNPILFKDLIIWLNWKSWRNLIIWFSLLYFLVFLSILSEFKDSYSFSRFSDLWSWLFTTIWNIQIIILMFIWYVKWLSSVTSEKYKNTFSFIKISPINSNDFILGKFLSIFIYIILLFFISLPFLSIWLLLWWINIYDILIYTIYSFSYISLAIFSWIFISITSNKFSSIIWLWIIPILIFLYSIFFIVIPFEALDLVQNGNNLIFALFPIEIYGISEISNTFINFYWINIHYLIYHIIFFITLCFFLFRISSNIYKDNYNLKNTIYSYFETINLFLIFLLISPLYLNSLFYLIFLFLVVNSIFYLFSDKEIKVWKKINIIFFMLITYLIWILFIEISSWFRIFTFLLYLSVILIIFSFYFLFSKLQQNLEKWLFNLFFFVILIMFFYLVPIISSNILEINFSDLNSLLKKAYNIDHLIDNWCMKKDNELDTIHESIIINDSNRNKCEDLIDIYLNIYIFIYTVISLTIFWLAFKNETNQD